MTLTEWSGFSIYIQQFEQEGLVTRTFRRLDPARQQAVINAILEEASEKGPASISIKEVARRAGVAVGSLYQYFPNRGQMFEFAVKLCQRYLEDVFRESRPYLLEMPLNEALRAYLSYGVEWGKTETGLVRFFGRAAYQGDAELRERVVRPVAGQMLGLVRDLLENARQRGELRQDLDVEAAARVLNALLDAVGDAQLLPYLNDYFQVTSEQVPPERALESMIDMVMRGIAKKEE